MNVHLRLRLIPARPPAGPLLFPVGIDVYKNYSCNYFSTVIYLPRMSRLLFVPVSYSDAKSFSCENHLYLDTFPAGHVFSIGFTKRMRLVGVITWGRPTNQNLDDGYTLQGYRLATDHSVKNMGSMLIARSLRVIQLLGYKRAIAYVRSDYKGSQVRACGFFLSCSGVRARDGSALNQFTYSFTLEDQFKNHQKSIGNQSKIN